MVRAIQGSAEGLRDSISLAIHSRRMYERSTDEADRRVRLHVYKRAALAASIRLVLFAFNQPNQRDVIRRVYMLTRDGSEFVADDLMRLMRRVTSINLAMRPAAPRS